MRRREFITLLGGAAAWPLAARAEQQVAVIGILSSRSRATDALLIAIFREALNDTGFVEGRNVSIEYRWAEGNYGRLAALAADLIGRKVAVIVTIGGDIAALAAKAATSTLPVVFTVATDPVRSGLVSNLHRPGGNLTGSSGYQAELEPKRLGLLRELRPDATNHRRSRQSERAVYRCSTERHSIRGRRYRAGGRNPQREYHCRDRCGIRDPEANARRGPFRCDRCVLF